MAVMEAGVHLPLIDFGGEGTSPPRLMNEACRRIDNSRCADGQEDVARARLSRDSDSIMRERLAEPYDSGPGRPSACRA